MTEVRILRQQVPFPRSILWAPASATRPGGEVDFPVFLLQSALQAIYEHVTTPPQPGQGVLGFLLGDRCECPVTGLSYSVIDAALRLNQIIYADRSRDVVTRLWKRLDAQLEAQQAHLIGWYHTHAPLPLELSAHDVETHELYFNEPWQVGMLVGTDPATPEGAFFRVGLGGSWARAPQPFYELLNEDSIRPDGKKRSFITWKNYRAYNPPGLQVRAAPAAPPVSKRADVRPEQTPPPPRTATPRAPHPQVDEAEDQPEPEEVRRETGMENMPQAELEQEPGRIDLDETPASVPGQPTRAEEPEESEEPEEWEDVGALRFLSAAEDSPPPPPSRLAPAQPPLPPPVHELPSALAGTAASDSNWREPALEQEPAQEPPPEPSAPPPPPPPPRPAARKAPRRRSPGRVRRWARNIAVALAGLLVLTVGVAFGPSLVQQVKALAPWLSGPAKVNSPPAAAPRPAAPRPLRTPRPELALLDQAGDSLARVLQIFAGRTRLFEKRQLDCPGLGRGVARVERAAATYGLQRNATRATLDPERVARDRELRAGIDAAVRQFQVSQCEHP